jgi:hypothetical protein
MDGVKRLRDYAEECLRLAVDNARSPDQALFLDMAQAWLALSIQLERIGALSAEAKTVDRERPDTGRRAAAGGRSRRRSSPRSNAATPPT